VKLPILTLEALDDLADDISPGPWSMNDRLEYVDGDGDPLLTDNGAVIYQSDEDLFLAAPAVLATARALYAERNDAPPPADVALLALGNRTLAADLAEARAEVERLRAALVAACDAAPHR
jgi:hypothetical protein